MVTAATVMLGMPVRNAMDMSIQLEPTLGTFAKPFMAIGLVAAGVSSAVCTPMGVSYVLAGLFGWKTNRSDKRYTVTNFLVLITGIIVAGMGFNPIALIMAAQMVNGVVLPGCGGCDHLSDRQPENYGRICQQYAGKRSGNCHLYHLPDLGSQQHHQLVLKRHWPLW